MAVKAIPAAANKTNVNLRIQFNSRQRSIPWAKWFLSHPAYCDIYRGDGGRGVRGRDDGPIDRRAQAEAARIAAKMGSRCCL